MSPRPAVSMGRRLLLWVVAPGLVLVVAGIVLVLVIQVVLAGRLGRIPGAFDRLTNRPAASGGKSTALNLLVAVTDSAATPPSWQDAAGGVALLMLLHVDADRRGSYLAVLPLKARVDLPGQGERPLVSALDGARPALAVGAVESLTGLRVDHLVLTTWAGLRQLGQETDEIDVAPFADAFQEGPTREQRQMEYLRLLTDETLHTRMRKRPVEVYRVVDALVRSTAVDAEWSSGEMRGLAFSLRNLRSRNIVFLAAPQSAAGAGGTGSDAADLWLAMARDDTAVWLAAHPEAILPPDTG